LRVDLPTAPVIAAVTGTHHPPASWPDTRSIRAVLPTASHRQNRLGTRPPQYGLTAPNRHRIA
jgi:hypothetical protein